MMKLHRPPAPDWLTAKCERWGLKYETNKQANPNHGFAWRQHQRTRINALLLPLLIEMTKDHCSFCDGYPMRSFGGNSIEHFKPKSNPKYYRLAYQWENLFLSCPVCQGKKLEDFDDALLKPDEIDYEFSHYFVFDLATGMITPNPAGTVEEMQRAKVTIDMYGLNEFDRPETRKQFYFQAMSHYFSDEDFTTYPYRFMFL